MEIEHLEEFKSDANNVIHFKLIRNEQEKDLEENGNTFQPEMTHQLFGETETIFGYRNLRIDYWCTAASLHTYLNVSYASKLNPKQSAGLKADNVTKILADVMAPGFTTDLNAFKRQLQRDEDFVPFGTLKTSYTVKIKDVTRTYEIYQCTIEAPGFREFHERLQTFLLFFVDAASYIDAEDSRWHFYLVFERYSNDSNRPRYATVGYMTVYNYYAYPEHVRPRIAQVLVLPPFQRAGHGVRLLDTFYADCQARTEVLDCTVEDASENFQQLRDFVDCRNALEHVATCRAVARGQTRTFTLELSNQLRTRVKICRRQTRRIYELLRLYAVETQSVGKSADERQALLRDFRVEVKRRIFNHFMRKSKEVQKLAAALKEGEFNATMISMMRPDQRYAVLRSEFERIMQEYRPVVEKLRRESLSVSLTNGENGHSNGDTSSIIGH